MFVLLAVGFVVGGKREAVMPAGPMIRAVLDTNVILATLFSRRGAAFEILERLRRG